MPDRVMMTLGQLVAERPARARVLERFHLDYCCGGRKPLGQACAEKGIDPAQVVRALAESDASGVEEEHGNCSGTTILQVIDHIQSAHHAYLRRELPRLTAMLEKLAGKHGQARPELPQVLRLFRAFSAELELHMRKEEEILFPACRALEAAQGSGSAAGGSMGQPVRALVIEHDDSADDLERIRALTNDYTPPPDACPTYRAAFDGLRELELDMHRHIHEENNILFPMVMAAEAAIARPARQGQQSGTGGPSSPAAK